MLGAHTLTATPPFRHLQDFQLVSLKLLAEQLLLSCQGMTKPGLGLYVPGELPRAKMAIKQGRLVYASPHNPGAKQVADDLRSAMGSSFEVTSDPEVGLSTATHFMLYLNDQTYLGEAGEKLANELRIAKGLSGNSPGVKVVMVHENDAARGGCDFGILLTSTVARHRTC